ncbi:MAG: hypothetical protein AD742_07450 [Methylibium sp. NZG]|nr:MAG: hypothetical protein AD742_07450 [Methylibium sp. NZG]
MRAITHTPSRRRLGPVGAACALVAASLSPQVAQSSGDTAHLSPAERVLMSADHRGLPFAIVDKRAATLTVYLADGRSAGTAPVLLGRTRGDHSVPGVGARTQAGQLRVDDRTTPAGRFDSEPGRNLAGEAVLWVDYASAFAIHRVRPGPAQQRRQHALAAGEARDRRLSAGCVVVPEAFFDAVVQPVLGRGPGVVYVLPEDGSASIEPLMTRPVERAAQPGAHPVVHPSERPRAEL